MFGNSKTTLFASTVSELLQKSLNLVTKSGHTSSFTDSASINIHGVTLMLNITDETGDLSRYPYWDKSEEMWYLKNFVLSKNPPESPTAPEYIFPYTYGWRSQHYDEGWGHVVQVVNLLRNLGYTEINFLNNLDLIQLIKDTYTSIHPAVLLSVLAWQQRQVLQTFIAYPEFAHTILSHHRKNILKHVAEHLIENPGSSFAMTPSLTYGSFDHIHLTSHAPSYQTFQALVTHDIEYSGNVLETIHHQKSMYADGSGQLDLAHDLLWGKYIANQLGIPHKKITIFVNELMYDGSVEENDLSVEKALLTSVNGYKPNDFDIEKLLTSETFSKKLEITLKSLLKQT